MIVVFCGCCGCFDPQDSLLLGHCDSQDSSHAIASMLGPSDPQDSLHVGFFDPQDSLHTGSF